MGGKWSIEARNSDDLTWKYCNYNLSFIGFIIKGISCLIKYDVVILGKHGGK
jgi:hypothetical protein